MKIIVISLLLLTIASAFLPENQLLESKHEDPTINILEIVEESNIEEKFEPKPRLQRQNAIRFPLSDSEEQINEESNKIDSFEADKSYYYGLNSSFSDLYNDWKNTNANTEDTNKVKNSIKESFEKVELALENIFDIVETGLFELSQEAEEKQTILGVDKATFHEKVKEMTTNFDEMFDEIYQVVTQISDQSASDQILSSIDKDSARETLNNLAENADEVFDEVLLALAQLSKEDSSIKTLFGFDKADIKQFVNLAESQFEIIMKDPSSLLEELFGQDMKKKSLFDSDLSTDESDADTTHFNELNSTIESLNEDEVELEEVLLELRKIFNETIEEQALYGSNLSIKINSDESDSSNVDNTYFNGLDSTADLPRDSEMNFEKLLIALQGLVEDAIEKEKASEPELIDE